jgi:FkbM family methyltransferase
MSLRKYFYYFTSIFTLLFNVKPLGRVLALFLGRKPDRPVEIQLRESGLRFYVRSAMDVWSIKETLLDHYYERCGFPIGKGWTIVDIGGGVGDFTLLAASSHPENKVYAYEPTPGSYALLIQNTQLNQINNIHSYPNGVWSSDGEISIDTEVGEPVQFISRAVVEGETLPSGKVTVRCFSMASLFASNAIARCDLMKLDCEGAEYEILFKTPDELLSRIDRIVMEYHDNSTQFTHRDMAAFLEGKGYTVSVFPNVVHEYLGYLRAERKAVSRF